MPYKDPERRNARSREKYAKRKAEDPEFIAKRAAQQAELHRKKQAEDEAYRAKRKADHDRWYAEFGKERARARYGYRPLEEYLDECEAKRKTRAEYMRGWHKTEAGRRNIIAQGIKKRCGLSIDEYDAIYDKQSGKCRICGVERGRYTRDRLVVDHCHESGKFRALLCSNCNAAIGFLEESEERLKNAILYLQEVNSEH